MIRWRLLKAHNASHSAYLLKSLFLTGYGLSTNVKNTRVVFKQGINDSFSKESKSIELPASACDFDKVTIQG